MSDTNISNRTTGTARNDVYMTPAVDVIEDATGITLYADLPGVPKDKLSLQVEADALTIDGEVALAAPEGINRCMQRSACRVTDACSHCLKNSMPRR